jgi:hypothetical protein
MLNAIVVSIRFILLIFAGQKQVALENAALRQQLAVFKRNVPRPKSNNRDRLFWVGLYMIWQDWKSALFFVQPETVTSWHHKRFRRYWWRLREYGSFVRNRDGRRYPHTEICCRNREIISQAVLDRKIALFRIGAPVCAREIEDRRWRRGRSGWNGCEYIWIRRNAVSGERNSLDVEAIIRMRRSDHDRRRPAVEKTRTMTGELQVHLAGFSPQM